MLALILSLIISLEADFVQTKQVAMLSEPQVAKGHLTYRAPEYIRWEYLKPDQYVWMLDGKQSNVNPQIQRLLQMIMQSVSGANLQPSQDFDGQQSGNVYTLTPRKREYKHMFRNIVITLDPATQIAQKVHLHETNGNDTLIEFHNVVTK